MRGSNEGSRPAGGNSDGCECRPQGCDGKTRCVSKRWMEFKEEASVARYSGHPKSRLRLNRKHLRTVDSPIFRADVHKVVEKLTQVAINKLDDRRIDIVNQTVLDALATFHVNQNKAFTKRALRLALSRQLVSVSKDSTRIGIFFEDAIIHVATAPKSLSVIAKKMINDAAAMKSNARFVSQIVRKGVGESVTALVLTPLSPPPSASDLSSNKTRKLCKDSKSKKKSSRCILSDFASDMGTWPLKELLKEATNW